MGLIIAILIVFVIWLFVSGIIRRFFDGFLDGFVDKEKRSNEIYEGLKNRSSMPQYPEYKKITGGGDAVEFADVKKVYFKGNLTPNNIEKNI